VEGRVFQGRGSKKEEFFYNFVFYNTQTVPEKHKNKQHSEIII
jgi:hypothetical protein